MKINNKLLIIFLVVVAVIGVIIILNITSQKVVCNEPYIRVGTTCCLDKNDNSICDKDESKGARLDICIKTYVAGKCTTDSDCIQKSKRYCGDLLMEGCEFGPMDVVCS